MNISVLIFSFFVIGIIVLVLLLTKKEKFGTIEHKSIGDGIIGIKNRVTYQILKPLSLKFLKENSNRSIRLRQPINKINLDNIIIDNEEDEDDNELKISDLKSQPALVNSTSEILPASDVLLDLENGLTATFGDILSMAGDFYGVPDRPICQGSTLASRKGRFTNCYNLLDKKDSKDEYGNFYTENRKLRTVMQEEADAVNDALQSGRNGSDAYAAFAGETKAERLHKAMKYAEATGAKNPCKDINPTEDGAQYLACTAAKMATDDLEGRYFKLAKNNLDHFTVDGALKAYEAGHTLALEKAVEARDCKTVSCVNRKLAEAYKLEAFACHFLTDMFATGHMRTQREMLKYGPSDFTGWSETVGDMMAGNQHDYDNSKGLYIKTNACFADTASERKKCKTFNKVYGDSKLLDSMNNTEQQQYRDHMALTVQKSIDQIWRVYQSGKLPTKLKVLKYLPNTNFMGSEYRGELESYRIPGLSALGYCVVEPETCKDLLGPEWRESSRGDCHRICVRDRINDSPLLYYDRSSDKMFYKREDYYDSFIYGRLPKNTMEDVDSQVLTYLMDTS